jgi:cytochrome c oxidase subunit 3
MAGHAVELDSKTLWGGKESPFSTSYGKLMMWFFLVSDALTFTGLLIAYGYTRHSAQDAWPIGEETFNSMPFLGHGYPLLYVALMTFILIVSSVTMVLAVEAGHRMDKSGVIKWMIATIIGGFFFVGSQAWEWSHFIHGSEFGKIELADGSQAIVKGHFGEIESFTVLKEGKHLKKGEIVKSDLLHQFQHAAETGKIFRSEAMISNLNNQRNIIAALKKDTTGVPGSAEKAISLKANLISLEKELALIKSKPVTAGVLILHDGSIAKINKKSDEHLMLVTKKSGNRFKVGGEPIKDKKAEELYYGALTEGTANKVVYGANLKQNEYGPQQYGQFFFFITGFHGFHVFSGVVINIIICIGVVLGTYHKRGHYEMIEKTGLYWHFVDLVWVFVFTFFYLI